MRAEDLAEALALYSQLSEVKTVREGLAIENLSKVKVEFKDNSPEKNTIYSDSLAGEDLNDVAKVVRRQLLVDINNLTIQLEQLGVEL